MLIATSGMLEESFGQFRRCGNGQRECVVYWTGPSDDPRRVDRVVHPSHRASAYGYEVDSGWITGFFLDLRRDGRSTRMQLHTHPGDAGHSDTDDRFALVPAEGFLSMVFPGFGLGPVDLEAAILVELEGNGTWRPRPTSDIEAS